MQDAGSCTIFPTVIGTVKTSDYAIMEASQTVMTEKEDVIKVHQDILAKQGEKMTITAGLYELDRLANGMIEKEHIGIENET